MRDGVIAPTGALDMKVLRGPGKKDELTVAEIVRYGFPGKAFSREVNAWKKRNLPHLWRGLRRVLMAKAFGIPTFYGTLGLLVLREDGKTEDYGLVSMRVVTDVAVGAIVDALDVGVGYTLSNLRYHGIGTGGTAENQTDTALVTELTTQYNPDSTRATGTASQPAANQYRSVGTNAVDAAVAITEHGIFSQAATGGGDLLDRTLFTVINLGNGDSLQSTYTLTLTAGS